MKCIDCQIGKAKQKNLNKSDQAKVLSYFIDEIEAETDKEVKIIRCDNAGENKTTEERFIREKRNIKFEYTARNTPQQNEKVERAFATLYGRMRAMMNYAGIVPEKRDKIWTEVAATATKLENILVDKKDEKSAYEKVYGKLPDYAKHLRTFGEVGIVPLKTGEQIKAKLNDRGMVCIFLGYAKKHAGNVYRMLNVKTNSVIVTRDVYWTNKMWYDQEGSPRVKVEYVETKTEEEEKEVPEIEAQQDEQEDSDEEGSENSEGTGSVSNTDDSPLSDSYWKNLGRKTPREIKGLRTYNNPGLMEQEERVAHFCFLVNKLETKYSEEEKMVPTTFREAWDHPNPYKRAKWREAIKLEFSQMIKNNVWRKNGIDELPGDRIGIGTKWIFTEKRMEFSEQGWLLRVMTKLQALISKITSHQ